MNIDEQFNLRFLSKYNPWWLDAKEIENDLKIEEFEKSKIKYRHPILKKFDFKKDAIYTLRGSRQIGKSTVLKLLIRDLLKEKKDPRSIFYFPGDYLSDYKELYEVLSVFIESTKKSTRKYIFIDEISFISGWTRAIKLLADEGKLKKCFVLLTGSLSVFVKGENEFMPGRRGNVKFLDKILYPLSFGEFVKILDKKVYEQIKSIDNVENLSIQKINNQNVFAYEKHKNILNRYWLDYILTGGYYLNINSFLEKKSVSASNYALYLESFRGDWLKLDREELLLKETLRGIIKQLGSTTSWLNLAKNSSVQSHLTMASSVELLEKLFAIKSLYNFDYAKKQPNIRKEKKIFFIDPFNLSLFTAYLEARDDYVEIYKNLRKSIMPQIVEGAVCSHLSRIWTRSYFYKDKNGEIDFLGQKGDKLTAYEVKYQNKITEKDFKMAEIFDNFVLISKDKFLFNKKYLALPFLWFLVNIDKSYFEEN